MIAEELLASFEKRFWKKVHKTPTCWVWIGAGCYSKGDTGLRGQIGLNGKIYLAYRISWELAHGPIPGKLWVLHKCDNPTCVRPDHLFLGTNRDNIDDSMRKGHRRGPIAAASGEKQGNAKLTWEMVEEIRGSSEGTHVMAKRLGISPKALWNVRMGRSWKEPGYEPRAEGVFGARGEKAYNARFSSADVAEIRISKVSITELARRFGVARQTIWRVKSGQSYA